MSEVRSIARGATPFERFKVGDTVAHINVGDGTVTSNDRKYIVVTYARSTGKFAGKYDARWFDLHPRYLFHRGIMVSEQESGPEAEVVRMPLSVRPLTTRYFPDAPYVVERVDEDDGVIGYDIIDMRPDSHRLVCSTSDIEGENPMAKHDAEQIARGLNFLVQYGLEQLPAVKDND